MLRFRLFPAALLLGGAVWPAAVAAQAMVQPLPGTTDADRLADAVRRLGANPRDLAALVEAGELSVRLGDTTAAAALFKRVEAIDPANGRAKAGIARILVNGELPGEALRYFDLAQRYGVNPVQFADDRGLAYDLIGEQERAQRDYRAALAQREDDEVRRRYALSLGISGRRDEALAIIDQLVRRSDRGAWRARAFILAMNGDPAGASRIANSMMPPGMATGLAAFFQRLPTLGAADRAFAVHFGEVSPTPTRLADARQIPPLPPLGADPTAPRPTQVTAVTEQPRSRRDRRNRARARQVAVTPAPAPAIAVASRPAVTPAPTPVRPASPITPPQPVQVATAVAVPRPSGPIVTVPAAPPVIAPTPAPVTSAAPQVTAAATPVRPTVVNVPPATIAAPRPSVAPAPGSVVAIPPVQPEQTRVAAVSPPAAAPVVRPAAITPPPASRASMGEDSILARIVAGITVPASELGIAAPAVAATTTPSLDEAAVRAERSPAVAERRQRLAPGATPEAAVLAASQVRRPGTLEAQLAAAQAKPRAPRASATAKQTEAATERGRPAERKGKPATTKDDTPQKASTKKVKADAPRIWVQVAGGANEGDLPKAWAAARAKAPALAGRSGYTTPLRATNRVVTGPFETEAQARAFVNQLGRQGLSAFTFTSAAGQKVTPIDGKAK